MIDWTAARNQLVLGVAQMVPLIRRSPKKLRDSAGRVSTRGTELATRLAAVKSVRIVSMLAILTIILATFLVPWNGQGQVPAGWDTFLGTAAQVIGGATAVVFALLVVPVQNAAARYSPMFLSYIRRDNLLRLLFGWTVVALTYALAALAIGPTPYRVGVTGFLTVSVILALGGAALRVMGLLNPIELAKIVEADMLRRLPLIMAGDRAQAERALEQAEKMTGVTIPAEQRIYPVSASVTQEVHARVHPLLSIAAGAIESGQVDVVAGVLTSVTEIVRAYLLERGSNASSDDPMISWVSVELFSLSQVAQRATNQQVLPEVVRALGRTASYCVEVSTPGMGIGERNVALMPVSQLKLIAAASLSNVNSVAPGVAADEIGKATYGLLQRGLPSFATGAIKWELAPLMQLSLQPFGYHVAALCARWLMRLWTLASAAHGDHLVRSAIQDAIESFLKAYQQEPASLERQSAVEPLVYPLSDTALASPRSPAGAAVSAGLLATKWPPDGQLLEDIRRLGDTFTRELLWPAISTGWRGTSTTSYAMHQTVEMAVLLAGIASRTFRHPWIASPEAAQPSTLEAGDDDEEESWHLEKQAAEKWQWLSQSLLGTCGRLTDPRREDEIVERWDVYRDALTGTSSCIIAALACLEKQESKPLGKALDAVIDQYCELGEKLVEIRPERSAWNPEIQHLRMIGAWLLVTGHGETAGRIASIVTKAQEPKLSIWDTGDRWSRRYPTEMGSPWGQPFISVNAQLAVPCYHAGHQFQSDEARERFEVLLEQMAQATEAREVAAEKGPRRPPSRRRPVGKKER